MSAVFPRRGGGFRSAWRELAARTWGTGSVDPELGERDAERVRDAIRACLEARGGELAARAQAASLGLHYLNLNDEGRRRFLRILTEFDLDRSAVDRAVAEMQGAQTDEEYCGASTACRAVSNSSSICAPTYCASARTHRCAVWTTSSTRCCSRGSISASSNCARSRGTPRRPSWKNSRPTKRSTKSAVGSTSSSAWRPIGAASLFSIR